MRYSVIIPVYNRPDEVDELLKSLTTQHYTDFEVMWKKTVHLFPLKK